MGASLLVVVSTGLRTWAALAVPAPWIAPDEFVYGLLGRSLWSHGTLEILGIHCFGANASEIIHIGQAIMSQQGAANTLLYFINTTFNYPTMAEAYKVAGLDGLNRL